MNSSAGYPLIYEPRPPRGVMLTGRPGVSVLADRDVRGISGAKIVVTDGTPRIGSPEFERLLDEETQSVARPGNRVQLLPNGRSAYAARDRLFADARDGEVIHQQTFVSNNDVTGWRNAVKMREHVLKGSARHIFDPIGSLRAVSDRGRIFEYMRHGGVEVAQLNEGLAKLLTHVNHLNHQKIILLGNRRAIIGGINIGDMYAYNGVPGSGVEGVRELGKNDPLKIVGWEKPYRLIDFRGWWSRSRFVTFKQPWHDMDFLIEGPVVADLQKAFIRTWQQAGRTIDKDVIEDLISPASAPFYDDGVSVRFIDHRPIEDGDDYITAGIVRHIDAAKKRITCETPYFSPPKAIRDALCRAAKRGVRVEVLTNSRKSINHKVAYDAGHGMYREMLRAGVRIYEKSPMLHGKFIVIDDMVTLGGSANLNGRTRYKDAETLIIVNGSDIAKQTRKVIEDQHDRCTRVTLDDLGGWGTKIRDFIAALIRKNA